MLCARSYPSTLIVGSLKSGCSTMTMHQVIELLQYRSICPRMVSLCFHKSPSLWSSPCCLLPGPNNECPLEKMQVSQQKRCNRLKVALAECAEKEARSNGSSTGRNVWQCKEATSQMVCSKICHEDKISHTFFYSTMYFTFIKVTVPIV
jgi:hypothetical protein